MEAMQMSFHKFEKGASLCPDNPQILSAWAEAQMVVGAQKGRLDYLKEALKKIEKSLDLQPEHPLSWYIYGNCLSELGRYFADPDFYQQAIEKFQSGLSVMRDDALLWYGLAQAHFAIGELQHNALMIEKATRFCARVMEFGGDVNPTIWNDWGIALMKLGVMQQDRQLLQSSLEKFEQAIKRHCEKNDPATIDPQWLYNYGCALDFLGDLLEDERYYERAIKILTQVLVLDPNFHHAKYNLAIAYSHLGEANSDIELLHKADEQFQAILNIDPEDEMAWSDWGVTLIHLARMVEDLSHSEQSLKIYLQAESKLLQAASLGNLGIFYHLSCLYSLLGNYNTAMHYLERAHEAKTLPSIDSLMEDEWLEGLRDTPAFQQFIKEERKSF